MKIAILTLPLITNYGGILQAYALQAVLKRMGHEVWTEKRKEKPLRLMGRIKMFIKRILGPIRKIYYATGKQDGIIFRYTDSFIYKYIATTEVRDFNIKEVSKKINSMHILWVVIKFGDLDIPAIYLTTF